MKHLYHGSYQNIDSSWSCGFEWESKHEKNNKQMMEGTVYKHVKGI